jgi:DMSO/TMAO reductase YedYZ molybdopterin-dependent catalytic subunit
MNKSRIRTGAAAVVLVALIAVALAGVVVPGGTPQASAADPIVLTVAGNGQTKTFTLAEVKALPAYTGFSGMKNSAGTLFKPDPVKGVKLTDLFAEVGGMTGAQSVDLQAVDDYGMTMTYGEAATGAFTMYNDTTGVEEMPKADVSAVLIYERDGAPLSQEDGAPLRLAICQPENVSQVADGHWLVKWVDRVTLRDALPNWTVKMYGLKIKGKKQQTSTLDRASYVSCAAPGCHGAAWTDKAQAAWTGVPLFLIMGRVDGGKTHDYGAYNEALALKGYRIKLTSASGKSVIIGSKTIRNRARNLLANKIDGADLGTTMYPLRLVGPNLKTSQFLGRIKTIKMLPK